MVISVVKIEVGFAPEGFEKRLVEQTKDGAFYHVCRGERGLALIVSSRLLPLRRVRQALLRRTPPVVKEGGRVHRIDHV